MKEYHTWVSLPLDERLTILGNIAEEKGVHENSIEKDFWVSMVLKAIFSQEYKDALCFKGGTSLSKGWNLIERFSEDIDLAIDRHFLGFGDHLGKNQRTKLRKASKVFIEEKLSHDLKIALDDYGLKGQYGLVIPMTTISDKDPVELFVEYKSILETKDDYIPEKVKIEISCRSMMEPVESIAMRSMIEDAYPEESFSHPKFNVPTVIPGRTFLEKIFLLHEEFNRPNGCTHLERLTRHMYDVEKMMDKDFAFEALHNTELYNEIIAHRQEFTAWSGLDYSLHQPQTISFVPPSSIINALKEDYKKMQESFIYGDSLSFEDLLHRISELQERFRGL